MTWLRWGARNLLILLGLLLAGSLLLVPAALIGWGDSESRVSAYVLLGIYAPFAAVLYLLVLALVVPPVRRPRLWAVLLTPLFWAFVPIFALGVAAPGIAALWVVFVAFGALVRLPPAAQDRT